MTEEQYHALRADDEEIRLNTVLEIGTPTNPEDMHAEIAALLNKAG